MRYVFLAVAALALAAISSVSFGAEKRFLVTGSSTVAPILQAVADRLAEAQPALLLDVQTGGSSRGIRDVRDGLSDGGMASRDLDPEEAVGIQVRPVAYDGIALIAHRDNPVRGLTTEQVRQLFTGAAQSWAVVGGADSPVHVVSKAEGRATLAVFLDYFDLDSRAVDADAVVGDNAQGVRLVAGNPDALGYVSVGEALTAVTMGEPIRLLELDGVAPTLESVASGSYSVRRTLYVLFPPESPIADRICGFLAGAEGARLIESLSFVPCAKPE